MNQVRTIPVWETIGMGWEKTKGAKGSIWAALFILILISIGLAIISAVFKALLPPVFPVINIIVQIIVGLLQTGIIYLGVVRGLDAPITFHLMFHPFQYPLFLKIIGLYILQSLIYILITLIAVAGIAVYQSPIPFGGIISITLFIVSGILMIYIGVRMCLALAFVFHQNANPWQAIKASFASTEGNFWQLLGIFIIQIVLFFISALPLLIGLIWTIPLLIVCYGVIYKRLALGEVQ